MLKPHQQALTRQAPGGMHKFPPTSPVCIGALQKATGRSAQPARVPRRGARHAPKPMPPSAPAATGSPAAARSCSRLHAVAEPSILVEGEEMTLEDIVLDFSDKYKDGYEGKMLLIRQYFEKRAAGEMAKRIAEVVAIAAKSAGLWRWEEVRGVPLERRTRARKLRESIATLGPVFVKLAQTLSTRPDIIGEEAADQLMILQDQMGAFEADVAYGTIREELEWDGPVHPGDATWQGPEGAEALFEELTAAPIAAASIGQVYKGRVRGGAEVAVKVQRPAVLRQIALDMHVARMGLRWLEDSGLNGSEDLETIVDEVGAAIFRELDYREEAANMKNFAAALSFLPYLVVPRPYHHLTTKRVMVQEWIRGRPMKDLSLEEQQAMVRMGVECSSVQLFRTGLVHADPHEGNMMLTEDGKLALLDFGLVCRVNDAQQEAMAQCILNILNADWGALIDNLRVIEMLPERAQRWIGTDGKPADYTKDPGEWREIDDADFKHAFTTAMGGGVVRTNFTELVIDLTKVSTEYRFQLPPYMVFVIRSLTTLDFGAVRTGCNMYELAAPTALYRALAPRTPQGRSALQRTLLDDRGNIAWDRLSDLASSTTQSTPPGPATSSGSEAVGTGGSSGGSGREQGGAEGAEGEDVGKEMARALQSLVGSSDGAALRRVLADANPGSLLPSRQVREVMCVQARAAFKLHTAAFSFRVFLSTAIAAVRSLVDSTAADEACDVSDDKQRCVESLEKRKREIMWLILRSKLAYPSGVLASLATMSLLAASALRGVLEGAVAYLRNKFTRGTISEGQAEASAKAS